jgi:hypothetical protein
VPEIVQKTGKTEYLLTTLYLLFARSKCVGEIRTIPLFNLPLDRLEDHV